MKELVRFTTALARLVGEGNDIVVSPLNGKIVVCAASSIPGDIPELSVTFFDIAADDAKAVVREIASKAIVFSTPPSFLVSDEYQGNAKFNIAPALVAFWQCGAGNVYDEMCLYCEDDQLGMAAIAIEAEIFAETGHKVEFDHAYATRDELADWADRMRESDEKLLRDIGKQVQKSLNHFKTHDLEGNKIGRGSRL